MASDVPTPADRPAVPKSQFVRAEWIGAGKKYQSVPDFVSAKKLRLLTPPQSILDQFIPSASVPVAEFVKKALPDVEQSRLMRVHPDHVFSAQTPNVDLQVLARRDIPCSDDLTVLENAFGQAWFDGRAESIVDWRHNDGRERLPVWVIHFWRRLTPVVEAQKKWRASMSWLAARHQAKDSPNALRETLVYAQAMFDRLGWDIRNPYGGRSTTLASFLSTQWLTDDHVDMMCERTSDHVRADPILSTKVLVVGVVFSTYIRNLGNKAAGWQNSQTLQYVAHQIEEGNFELLVFPINLSNTHWIAGAYKIKEGIITYGDSLGHCMSPPRRFLENLQSYIARSSIGKKAVITHNQLEHGVQDDSYSCGICTVNTMSRAIFGSAVQLWQPGCREQLRVKQLLHFARACLESKKPDSSPVEEWSDARPACTPAPPPTRPDIVNLLNEGPAHAQPSDAASSEGAAPAHEPRALLPSSSPSSHQSRSLSPSRSRSPSPDRPRSLSPPHPSHSSPAASDSSDSDSDSPPSPPRARMPGHRSTVLPRKRRHASASEGSASEVEPDVERPATRRRVGGPTGYSRTAQRERENRAAARAGTAEVNPRKLELWRNHCRHRNPNVVFHPTDLRKAQHSNCKHWTTGRWLYDRSRFDGHVDNCKKRPVYTLFDAWQKGTPKATIVKPKKIPADNPPPPVRKPCPGIRGPAVERYIDRTMMTGGGAPSETALAHELHDGRDYASLTSEQKEEIQNIRLHQRRWVNSHHTKQVFATDCLKTISFVPGTSPEPCMCASCERVSHDKTFLTAVARPTPAKGDRKFTPARFRTGIFAEIYADTVGLFNLFSSEAKHSIPLEYAIGSLEGRYDDELFVGMMHALLVAHSKEERGVGMQNFQYMPAYDEFMHIVHTQSPSTANLLRTHLPMRSERSMREKTAREPKLPLTICPETFDRVDAQLEALGCKGEPVCTAVDDTTMTKKLGMYWDSVRQVYIATGGDKGPVQVADPETLRQRIENRKIDPSEKMRCFVLQVTTHPKALPILVAALPLPLKTDAQFLCEWSLQIINGLLDKQIRVVSYACDGTEVERSVQQLLLDASDGAPVVHTIYSLHSGVDPVTIRTVCIRQQHIALIRDSKHALKTFRNNLYSGARCLVIGDFPLVLEMLRGMVLESGSPLMQRDVLNPDRQDDNAARRLTSAATMDYIASTHPDWVGLAVYLFVAGELVDAYQSRSLTHSERLEMVLTAHFFVEAWITSLKVSQYPIKQYCISREALDITRLVVQGYISLFYIYRDQLGGTKPLMPWMHGTETVEHIFGEARKVEADFTYQSFIFNVPKMSSRMRNTILHARMSSKATASGYNHTYFDTESLDLAALQRFPDDMEVSELAAAAARQTDDLLRMCGIDPAQLEGLKRLMTPRRLPSLRQWFPRREDDHGDEEADGGGDEDDDTEDEGEESLCEQLQNLINREEAYRRDPNRPLRSAWDEREIEKLIHAAVALSIGDAMDENALYDDPGPSEVEIFTDHGAYLRAAENLPPVLTDERSLPVGHGPLKAEMLDLHVLADIRRSHQTYQAVAGIRTTAVRAQESAKQRTRRELLRRFNAVLKAGQEKRVGTGMIQKAHYTTAAHGKDQEMTGNAANAASALQRTAAQVTLSHNHACTNV
ncbi:hypothetical protein EV715DRAFT_213952 [Schizophyllum commune]